MKRLLLVFLFLSGTLEAMDGPFKADDEILYFNIGGYEVDINRSTIEQFGGEYLNTLIEGHYPIRKDRNDRIFIGRSPKEAEIIFDFIFTQRLPADIDEIYARSAADFFGLDSMTKYIDELKLEFSPLIGITKYPASFLQCKECSRHLHNLTDAMLHMTNEHRAEIVHLFHGAQLQDGSSWVILYRVPIDTASKTK